MLDAYRRGLFPMRADGVLAWWSPGSARRDPARRLSRAAGRCARAIARFEIRVDTAFEAVMRGVRAIRAARTAGSTSRSCDAYTRLHELGWAHSVEVWRTNSFDAELVGGLPAFPGRSGKPSCFLSHTQYAPLSESGDLPCFRRDFKRRDLPSFRVQFDPGSTRLYR